MANVMRDFIGAIYDSVKFIVECLGYFFAGALIVGIPLVLIVFIFNALFHYHDFSNALTGNHSTKFKQRIKNCLTGFIISNHRKHSFST